MSEVLKKGTKCEFAVNGMHCAACELTIEKKFAKSKHMKHVNAVLSENKVYLEIENDVAEADLLAEMNSAINTDGYTVSLEREKHQVDFKLLQQGLVYALIVVGVFVLLQKLGIANFLGGGKLTLPLVFSIGIVASLSSCMAVVGGLVLSISSSYAQSKDKAIPLIFFHIARLASFLILGGVVGYLGSLFTLGPTFYLVTSIILFAVMVVLGMNLLDIFPIFRKFQLTMPKVFTKKAVMLESVQSKFTPIMLGVLTFFLPCGFTQSMQVSAMTSGSWLTGALIMFVFSLGTLPILSLISFTSVKFAKSLSSGVFFKAAGFIILFFAVFNLYSALVAAGYIVPLF